MHLKIHKFVPLMCGALTALLVWSCSDDATRPDGGTENVVSDLSLTYPAAGGPAVLTWTSPPVSNGPAAAYEIRYSYSPLVWDLGLTAENAPAPAAPGLPQSYEFVSPLRGRDLYAAVRVVDADGKLLPMGPSAHVRIPGHGFAIRCVDVYTRAPAPGLSVTAASTSVLTATTDTNGEARFEDLASGVAVISVSGDNGTVPYHRLREPIVISTDTVRTYAMIPVETTSLPGYDTILNLFILAEFGGSDRVLKKYDRLPVPLYAPPFVNESGVDYQAMTHASAQRWMDLTGIPLFTPVDAPPDTGITVEYLSREVMSPQVGVTRHFNGEDGFPVGELVRVVNDATNVEMIMRIMMHELGHTIRLKHLPLGTLMYAGQPIPSDPTDDEIRVVRIHAGLANETDITIYDIP